MKIVTSPAEFNWFPKVEGTSEAVTQKLTIENRKTIDRKATNFGGLKVCLHFYAE